MSYSYLRTVLQQKQHPLYHVARVIVDLLLQYMLYVHVTNRVKISHNYPFRLHAMPNKIDVAVGALVLLSSTLSVKNKKAKRFGLSVIAYLCILYIRLFMYVTTTFPYSNLVYSDDVCQEGEKLYLNCDKVDVNLFVEGGGLASSC